ncbi:class I SAM-dependent methyltransferase [Limibacter armeniacum]|uniref:class I SAM-dependent methyltransferase n=1 Tax=Limibacter armeniacum TaxID=466084 RepID=UPI002FE5A495
MGIDLYNHTYDKFCALIEKHSPFVLELGCGPGNITKYLLDKRPDILWEGVDVSPKMIELAKINNPTANFQVMDIRNLSGFQQTFDAIVAGFCIPYLSLEDCAKLFSACSNLLTDGGIFYLSFVEGDHAKSGFQSGSTGDRMYFYFHNLMKITAALKTNQLDIIETYRVEYPRGNNFEVHTILLIRKN